MSSKASKSETVDAACELIARYVIGPRAPRVNKRPLSAGARFPYEHLLRALDTRDPERARALRAMWAEKSNY